MGLKNDVTVTVTVTRHACSILFIYISRVCACMCVFAHVFVSAQPSVDVRKHSVREHKDQERKRENKIFIIHSKTQWAITDDITPVSSSTGEKEIISTVGRGLCQKTRNQRLFWLPLAHYVSWKMNTLGPSLCTQIYMSMCTRNLCTNRCLVFVCTFLALYIYIYIFIYI